jgi:Ser-tRNA(Ala) deacylase AlaX
MTRRLYYEDSFISEFDAVVTSCEPVDNGYAVTLDQTAFFGRGGPQKATRGRSVMPIARLRGKTERCIYTAVP